MNVCSYVTHSIHGQRDEEDWGGSREEGYKAQAKVRGPIHGDQFQQKQCIQWTMNLGKCPSDADPKADQQTHHGQPIQDVPTNQFPGKDKSIEQVDACEAETRNVSKQPQLTARLHACGWWGGGEWHEGDKFFEMTKQIQGKCIILQLPTLDEFGHGVGGTFRNDD